MISLCCCAMNAREDVRSLLECLDLHNKDTEFEVCLTHDNRVNDGSTQTFIELMKKYPWFKVVENTHQDTWDWFEWMLDIYENDNQFRPEFRQHLAENLKKLKAGELVNFKKEFLWISSGILYNKAVGVATGDNFLIGPADFMYFFQMADLDNVCNSMASNGLMYGKIHAIWSKVSNCPVDWLKEAMVEDSQKTDHPFNSRMACAQKDYLCYPSGPQDLHLIDFRHQQLINLADSDFFPKVRKYIDECFENQQDQAIGPSFHGTHVMSRDAYKALGGFSERFYGRAFADDNMSRRGCMLGNMNNNNRTYILPQRFSFGWIGQGEYIPSRFTYRTAAEHHELLQTKHNVGECPIPGASGWSYLHHQYPDNAYMHLLNDELKPYLMNPPDRFTADKW